MALLAGAHAADRRHLVFPGRAGTRAMSSPTCIGVAPAPVLCARFVTRWRRHRPVRCFLLGYRLRVGVHLGGVLLVDDRYRARAGSSLGPYMACYPGALECLRRYAGLARPGVGHR